MDKKKKKIIIAVVLNVIALVTIIIMMKGDSTPQLLINTGKDLSNKFVPLVLKGEFFKESNSASLTVKEVKYMKLKKQNYRVIISYNVTGDEEVKAAFLYLEGKVEGGEFNFTKVDQKFIYKDGSSQNVKFDPSKDSALLLK